MEAVYVFLLLETINCPWCCVTEMPRCQSNSSLKKSVMRINNHFVDQVSLQLLNSNPKTSGFSLCSFRPFIFITYNLGAGKLSEVKSSYCSCRDQNSILTIHIMRLTTTYSSSTRRFNNFFQPL